jgi:trimeric autotransporter adhesin
MIVTVAAGCGDNLDGLPSDGVPGDAEANALVALDLSFAGGRLSDRLRPQFAPSVSDYSADFGFWLESIQVTATAASETSTVTINDVQTPSGQPSSPIALEVGATTITILVTSDGGDPRAYSLVVTRASGARQEAYVKAAYTAAGDLFGEGIAIEGETLAIAARLDDHIVPESGAVYTFRRSEDSWVPDAVLKASDPGYADHFGGLDCRGLALFGDTLAVAAPEEDGLESVGGNQTDSGAVYVFRRENGTWHQEGYLKKPDPGFGERFGTSVALWGTTLVIGASSVGLVYVFTRSDDGTWMLVQVLTASNADPGDGFGTDVGIWENTIVVSAPGESSGSAGPDGNQADNSLPYSGATYVFEKSDAGWVQTSYLKASNPGALDFFGNSIALSADTLVVGANREDSLSTGINGEQASTSDLDTGAAYVFVRQGATWTQQAYVKASDVDANDHFGRYVGVWGNTLVVGALGEDSPSVALDGSQTDSVAGYNSGAAYVFTRRGTEWTQTSYVKASTNGESDWFGYRIAVWADIVLVGTMNEDSNATGIDGDQTNNSAPESGAAYVFR